MSVVDLVTDALDGGAHQLLAIISLEADTEPQLRADTFQGHEPAISALIGIVPEPVCRNPASPSAACYLPQDADVQSAAWQATGKAGNS